MKESYKKLEAEDTLSINEEIRLSDIFHQIACLSDRHEHLKTQNLSLYNMYDLFRVIEKFKNECNYIKQLQMDKNDKYQKTLESMQKKLEKKCQFLSK